jgi:hypothetical protein
VTTWQALATVTSLVGIAAYLWLSYQFDKRDQ